MDRRTLREKLEAMAAQDASPEEAEIAARKLLALSGSGQRLPPQRPPAAPAPSHWYWSNTTNSYANVTFNVRVQTR